MYGILSGGPLQIFLSVLAFGLLKTVAKASTRGHVNIEGGQRILRYNVVLRMMTFLFLLLFLGLDVLEIWLMTFQYKLISAQKNSLAAAIFSLIFIQAMIAFIFFAIFGTRIGFDESGVYRIVFTQEKMLIPWTEISSFLVRSQILILSRNNRKIAVSSYRNGRDDLIAELRSRNIPSR